MSGTAGCAPSAVPDSVSSMTQTFDETTRNIPVILLSAKGRNVDQKVGFEVGADDYITKPFSPRKLVERINAILGQSSGQRMQA